jgi:tetratricopeptide (TPR) repeat protein
VLDLHMGCLNDNLDQIRALTDTLMTADSGVVSRATSAALDLTPVARCSDVSLLKSAVPPPRDERTLGEVRRLQRVITEAETLREFGRSRLALAKAVAIRPQVESTGFKALLGELLQEIGLAQTGLNDPGAEKTLEEAVFVAAATRDDATVAKAATSLIYVVGYQKGRVKEAELWMRLANASLDRLGTGHRRTRAWALHDYALVLWKKGNFEAARPMLEQAVALKEQELGKDHPDAAISLVSLGMVQVELDRLPEALASTERAIAIEETCCEPNSIFETALNNKGEILHLLHRESEARQLFRRAMQVGLTDGEQFSHPATLDGLGEIELAEGNFASAIPPLEKALSIYARPPFSERDPTTDPDSASTRYSLAQALWESRADRPRALRLAEAARQTFASTNRPKREHEVAAWLASHAVRRERATDIARTLACRADPK